MGVSNRRTLPGIERRVGRHPEEHEDSTERRPGADLNEIGDRVGRHIVTGTYDWSDRGPVSPIVSFSFPTFPVLPLSLPRMC